MIARPLDLIRRKPAASLCALLMLIGLTYGGLMACKHMVAPENCPEFARLY